MRAVVQRVTEASVTIEGQPVAAIGPGLVVLLGVGHTDSSEQARRLAEKVARLRAFADQAGKFNLSALEVGAEILVVSQFTLYADTSRGRRPGFSEAAPPQIAAPLVEAFIENMRALGLQVQSGRFGAYMQVKIYNDGPVTLLLETD